jgi:hypothetical protein
MAKIHKKHVLATPVGTVRRPPNEQWTDPLPLRSIDVSKISGSGCYRVVLIRDGQPIPIHRLLGTDNEGILYIGMSTDLARRIADIIDSFLTPSDRHGSGAKYHRFRLSRQFPIDLIHVQWCNLEVPELSKREFELQRDIWEDYDAADSLRKKLIDANETATLDELDKAAAMLWERSGLSRYTSSFGETPPLNRASGSHEGPPLPSDALPPPKSGANQSGSKSA